MPGIAKDQFAGALRALIVALEAPERNWQAIETLWFNACAWALDTEHEEELRTGGLALRLRYADRLRAAAQRTLASLDCG